MQDIKRQMMEDAQDEYDDRPAPATRTRVQVPTSVVGQIIGKGGANIRALEVAHQVTIAPVNSGDATSGATTTVFEIVGTRERSVAGARVALTDQVRKLTEPTQSATIDLPTAAVGSLIGKGGANITRLREESGAANIAVARSVNDPNVTIVTVTGSKRALAVCKRRIGEITVGVADRASGASTACAMDVDVPMEAVGRVIGAQGSAIRALSSEFAVQASHEGDGRFVVRGASMAAVSAAATRISHLAQPPVEVVNEKSRRK